MTKREAIRQTAQINTLVGLGFSTEEAVKLRRISMTLQRWYELECGSDGGCIERDEETGLTYWRSEYSGRRTRCPDRETGAVHRLRDIINARNVRQSHTEEPFLNYYLQTDPRGAALYILRPQDIPEGKDLASYYSRGICIY